MRSSIVKAVVVMQFLCNKSFTLNVYFYANVAILSGKLALYI